MKAKKTSSLSRARVFIDIFCLVFLFSLSLFTPIFGAGFSTSKPKVLAAYVSTYPTAVSKGLSAPSITAKGVYIIDFNSGQILFEKNPHHHLKPASLTKIMTALVALDFFPEDYVLRVVNGQKSIGATAGLVYGDKLTFINMLSALLIPSGNDAAVTIAENYPGGYNSFVAAMNSKVSYLGLSDTHFTNVSGIEGKDHYTSAYDILMIARSALKRNLFLNTVGIKRTTIRGQLGYRYPLETTNKLLNVPGVLGVKTGWTPEAGECLVSYVDRNDHPILISLLDSSDRFGESEELLNWVYKNYSWE